MKTVLVTGAEGALGKAMLALLERKGGWQVFATSRRPADERWLALDVSDRAQVFRVIADTTPDLVLHLAATLSDKLDEATAINVEGARNLCDAVLASRHPSRVLLTGSAAEYGAVQATDNPISTQHPLEPVSVYGSTKAAQTALGLDYARQGVDVVIARIFNLDGPGISERLFVGRVQKQIAAIKAGQQTRLRVGPLSAIRDYVPLATAAEQILDIAERGTRGSVYHVGSGRGISMSELLQQYLERNGLDFSLVDEDSGHSTHRGYDVPAIFADMSGTTALQSGTARKS
jgi:GDP-4-dehydro-6-deoxy-D-mannose reductase